MPKENMNSNCLEGKMCPRCKSQGPFRIAATALFTVEDDGTEDYEDVEWNDRSYFECKNCHCFGMAWDFEIRNRDKLRLPDEPKDSGDPVFDSILDLARCRIVKTTKATKRKGGHRG